MLHSVDLHLEPNEASDLAEVHEPGLLAAHDWDRVFLTVLDEGRVEDCVALLAHDAGASMGEGWSSHRLAFAADGDDRKTEDAEALAVRSDGTVYVFGSHYGSKEGPLEPKRHFVARFDHGELEDGLEGAAPPLTVARSPFRLHRAVNDALRAAGVELFGLAPGAREALVGATVERGEKKDKGWRDLVRADDLPINIEGTAFHPDGRLLIGLRFPTTADGHPLIVALDDVDALVDDPDAMPACSDVWWLAPGSRDRPVGFRALDPTGDGERFQAILGSLDSEGKDSVLVEEHPEVADAGCAHWRFGPLPAGGGEVGAELVHDFGDLKSVEGVADGAAGHAFYVVDEEARVDMRFLLVE